MPRSVTGLRRIAKTLLTNAGNRAVFVWFCLKNAFELRTTGPAETTAADPQQRRPRIPSAITVIRPPRAKTAIAYSTKDRTDYSRQTATRFLNDDRFDLYWFDGSETEAGRTFAVESCRNAPAACELHHGVKGGPDAAILYALATLRGRGYEWIILVENDVLVEPGWYEVMMSAVEAAQRQGFRVGGASARVHRQRVLSANDGYSLLYNAGAGFLALTPAALEVVLENYRTTSGAELRSVFLSLTGVNVQESWEFNRDPAASFPVCADWYFDAAIYRRGMVVVGPSRTQARNIDEFGKMPVRHFVETEEDVADKRQRVPTSASLRPSPATLENFQKSPVSDRLLVPCHRLRLGRLPDRTAPVALSAGFQRRWNQVVGPFELWGDGDIVVRASAESVHCLLHAREKPVRVSLRTADGGTVLARFALMAERYKELSLAHQRNKAESALIRVEEGEMGMIGLTMRPSAVTSYANGGLDIAFLNF